MPKSAFPTRAEYEKHIRMPWNVAHNIVPKMKNYVPGYGYSKIAIDAMFEGYDGGKAQVHWSRITNKPGTFPPSAHTLASHSTKAHNELTDVTADQHHPQAHTLASHSTKPHSALTDVTSDQHHAQLHAATHAPGQGDAFTVGVPSSIGNANSEGVLTTFVRRDHVHNHPAGLGADLHHNQSHVLAGAYHTASGLTIGHVIRATGVATFAWAELQHGDLGGVSDDQHHTKSHNLLNTSHHMDVLTGAPVRGDIIIANVTPKWSRLAKGENLKYLRSGATDVYWDDVVRLVATGFVLNTLIADNKVPDSDKVDGLHANEIASDHKVQVDAEAVADYLGAARSDGVLRASHPIAYQDGGDAVSIGLNIDASYLDVNPSNELRIKLNTLLTGVDADKVDGEHASAIVTDARVKAHFPDTIANILSDHTLAVHNALDITELGTVSSGVWQGTAIANAYIAGIDQNLLQASNVIHNSLTTTKISAVGKILNLDGYGTAFKSDKLVYNLFIPHWTPTVTNPTNLIGFDQDELYGAANWAGWTLTGLSTANGDRVFNHQLGIWVTFLDSVVITLDGGSNYIPIRANAQFYPLVLFRSTNYLPSSIKIEYKNSIGTWVEMYDETIDDTSTSTFFGPRVSVPDPYQIRGLRWTFGAPKITYIYLDNLALIHTTAPILEFLPRMGGALYGTLTLPKLTIGAFYLNSLIANNKVPDSDKLDNLHATGFIKTAGGGTISSGGLTLNDNIELHIGTDGDFAVWHDGSNHYIRGYLHGANINLQAEDDGGILRTCLTVDPDLFGVIVPKLKIGSYYIDSLIANNKVYDSDRLDGQHGAYYSIDGHTHAHNTITGVAADQHHAESHTLASHSTKAHSELTDVTEDQHHTKSHNLINSAQHMDTLTGAPIRGDIIIANATPKWSRLAKGANMKYLRSGATDVYWDDVVALVASGFTLNALIADNKVPDSDKVDGEHASAIVTKTRVDAQACDHGALSGRGDDDHSQYYNSARHTKALHDGLNIDADTLDDYNASITVVASTVVVRNASGHIYCAYLNCTSVETTANPSHYFVEANDDSFVRQMTPANFVAALVADGLMPKSGGIFTAGVVAADHGAAATDQIVNVCYGIGDPPLANTTTIGTLFIKYTT